ncbi:diiron oxygenase [Nonomuraea sp. LP-02]|uniref:diiron oxygenase n=1 Tax=Nonomuraea sp. LP-02 TaxID=3097960 RepID=UPI002E3573F8|nr:diiron oxygenase [Nonomuraea sp. LP-02]MED7925808.1 diiron oxygenase [Nonomuraea sp. LP-02]
MEEDILGSEQHVGPSTLKRLVAAWPRRATIRTDMAGFMEPQPYERDLTDYPAHLIPFSGHPRFLEATPEQRRLVNTLAWQAYNARVIAAEEHVANPTFEMLGHGVFPGVDRYEVKEAIQQSHIDEVWHTYMHMTAMRRTQEAHGLTSEPDYSHPVTNRRLYRLTADMSEKWERDLMFLLWTVVGEVSINTFLELLSRDRTIQPMHTLVARLHGRDEAAHGPILADVMKDVYVHLNKEQRELFIRALPEAIVAFGAEDYELWPEILSFAGVEGTDEIIADTRQLPGNELLVTDFSTVERLVRDLEIADRVAYDFTTNQVTA